MEVRLDGKVAVVTGASRGIGRATAQALAAAGASVMLTSRKAADLEKAVGEIGGDTAFFAANAGDEEAAAACLDATLERFGAVDLLVNNAATNPYYGPTVEIDAARAAKTAAVNQIAPITWTRLARERGLGTRPGASVVNVASIGAFSTEANIGFYNATKAALVLLTRQLASELGPEIRVNAVAPGLVVTDMAKALVEAYGDRLAARLPLRRLGQPDDIARAIVFLASDAASWVTGHTLVVDGGSSVAGSSLG
ncbi:MAG TPA: SDR family oxidoreductase [Acidimicrobiales bacterium]|nr:SDR family oxidoreductase [Acidimicrobiales bacterium]